MTITSREIKVTKEVTVHLHQCSAQPIAGCPNELDPGATLDEGAGPRWLWLSWHPDGGGTGQGELFCSWSCVVAYAQTAPPVLDGGGSVDTERSTPLVRQLPDAAAPAKADQPS